MQATQAQGHFFIPINCVGITIEPNHHSIIVPLYNACVNLDHFVLIVEISCQHT